MRSLWISVNWNAINIQYPDYHIQSTELRTADQKQMQWLIHKTLTVNLVVTVLETKDRWERILRLTEHTRYILCIQRFERKLECIYFIYFVEVLRFMLQWLSHVVWYKFIDISEECTDMSSWTDDVSSTFLQNVDKLLS